MFDYPISNFLFLWTFSPKPPNYRNFFNSLESLSIGFDTSTHTFKLFSSLFTMHITYTYSIWLHFFSSILGFTLAITPWCVMGTLKRYGSSIRENFDFFFCIHLCSIWVQLVGHLANHICATKVSIEKWCWHPLLGI